MPSPFSGLNPYLEDPDKWPDLHATFMVAFRAAINVVLPDRYVALAPVPGLRETDATRARDFLAESGV
jgi:hypothetical protein